MPDVRILNKADRRPVRNDLPPRRIRAIVPAHSNPLTPLVFRFEFASLIDQ